MSNEILIESNRILSKGVLQEFISGGKGVVILASPTGKSHSYLFSRPKSDGFPDDVLFVYAIHQDKRFYLGMIEEGRFRLTQHSRFERDTECTKGAFYIVRCAKEDNLLSSTPMRLYHNGRCARCGRKLESKRWTKIGLGKSCYKRVKSCF